MRPSTCCTSWPSGWLRPLLMPGDPDIAALAEAIRCGDRAALPRAITLVGVDPPGPSRP